MYHSFISECSSNSIFLWKLLSFSLWLHRAFGVNAMRWYCNEPRKARWETFQFQFQRWKRLSPNEISELWVECDFNDPFNYDFLFVFHFYIGFLLFVIFFSFNYIYNSFMIFLFFYMHIHFLPNFFHSNIFKTNFVFIFIYIGSPQPYTIPSIIFCCTVITCSMHCLL